MRFPVFNFSHFLVPGYVLGFEIFQLLGRVKSGEWDGSVNGTVIDVRWVTQALCSDVLI